MAAAAASSIWKPGTLKAHLPETVLAQVASMVSGWDPAWTEELLAKTEETLRTPDHALIKEHGPFASLTTLDTARLGMVMLELAFDLTIEKLEEKENEWKDKEEETLKPFDENDLAQIPDATSTTNTKQAAVVPLRFEQIKKGEGERRTLLFTSSDKDEEGDCEGGLGFHDEEEEVLTERFGGEEVERCVDIALEQVEDCVEIEAYGGPRALTADIRAAGGGGGGGQAQVQGKSGVAASGRAEGGGKGASTS